MDIRNNRNEQIDNFFLENKKEEEFLEAPHGFFIPEHSVETIRHWQAPEYEVYERDKKWYVWVTLALIAIIIWALYTNSPVMAITFILIGVVGYIHINREPIVMDFMITRDGLTAGKEIYDWDTIRSFWIFYESDMPRTNERSPQVGARGKRVISLHMENSVIPYVHIPIHEEDPVEIREILLDYLPEEKHEQGIVEILERVLRI